MHSTTGFAPESSLVTQVVPSPNFGERRDGRRPDMLVLHYTGMASADAALERLCTPQAEVSCHYLVFEDGRVVQCVPEGKRAWHAGAAVWAGESDINSCSIGIEIANPGHELGYADFPRRQIAAVTALCRGILTRHRIAPERVLGHSDVAPSRKRDPGEKFPWRILADSGVGAWTRPAPLRETSIKLGHGDSGDDVRALQNALAEFGYGLTVDGHFDSQTHDVVTAFQRHFRPERVDGVADQSTLLTLQDLLKMRSPLFASHHD